MFCSNCGAETEDGSAFCGNCGESLLDDGAQPVDARNSAIRTAQVPSCQAGAQPQAQPARQAPAKKKGSKVPIAISIVAIALVVIIAVVAFMFVSGNNDDGVSSDGVMHEVSIETFGGTQYKSDSFETGTTIEKFNDPVRTGFTFEGWYLDDEFKKQVTFPYIISRSDPETITFYAKWKENPSTESTPGSMDYMADATSILPLSSTTYLTEADLYGLTSDQIQRAINEIYARNGYIFQQSATEKQYFESRPWYRGTETDQDVVKSRFNQFENANIRLMQSYRDSRF